MFTSGVYATEAIDSDGDGVPNDLDQCPNLQEDYEGTVDGCPDSFDSKLDSDMDGILDVFDACPLELETYNLYLDGDGCPDSVGVIDSTYTFPDTDGINSIRTTIFILEFVVSFRC